MRPTTATHWAVPVALMLASLTGVEPARAQSDRSEHHVAVGIRPILALDVQAGQIVLSAGDVMTIGLAMTSNVTGAVLTARLDRPMPADAALLVHADPALAGTMPPSLLQGADRAIVVPALPRGARPEAVLAIEAYAPAPGGRIVRTLTIGLEDPVSGHGAWETVRLVIEP